MTRLALPIWITLIAGAVGWWSFTRVEVIDGDTVQIGFDRYRIWGLHAPERHTPEGRAAMQALERLVASGHLFCAPTGHVTRDRQEARCDVDGLDVAEAMIAGGWGLDCPAYSGGVYREFETNSSIALPEYCLVPEE